MKNLVSNPFEFAPSGRMLKSIFAMVVLSASLGAGGTAVADPKPSPSKAVSAQVLANKFAGHTHIWKSCKGGAYFGSNWEVVAYCGKHKNSVGVGTWSTQGGKLCRKVTWYFAKNGKLATKQEETKCDFQVISDKDGQYWHSWEGDSDWWRGFPKEKSFPKGNKFKRQINKLRKKYGV